MSGKKPDPIDEVKDITDEVGAIAAHPETFEPPVKLVIIPGRVLGENERHPGERAAYFVRTEGTTNTQQMMRGSLEENLQDIFGYGSEATDFIAASRSPQQVLAAAEELQQKLSDPAMQQRVRRFHAEHQKLRKDLLGE